MLPACQTHAGGVGGACPTRYTRARACLTHPPCACDASARLLRAQGNNGPICPSDIAAACSMAPRVRAVHVLCASSGADARTRSGKVATVLAVHGAAVDDGVTEVSQGSWSVAVAVLV